jgi:iron complex transport system substrate-binding protein
LAAALGLGLPVIASAAPPDRVLSVDQCADQYVIALADRAAIVGVSPLAKGPDSYMRVQAAGLPEHRATLESVLAAHPRIVVRSWTPDARLVPALRARGIEVVQIGEADDFAAIRRNVRAVASALGRAARGEALIARMNADLAQAHGAWGGRRALYLTPGGVTAGSGTLTDAILSAAGLINAASRPGYSPVPLEKLALTPPDALVLGFFDPAHVGRWSVGRRPIIQRLAREHAIAAIPADLQLCPAWFSGKAALAIAAQAPRDAQVKRP